MRPYHVFEWLPGAGEWRYHASCADGRFAHLVSGNDEFEYLAW